MAKIIEARAIISGEDRLSGVLDKLNGKMKQIGRGMKASADVDKLNKSLESTQKQLQAIERLNAAQAKFGDAKYGLGGARAQADRITAALAAAKKAGDATATKDLTGQNRVAQRALSQANAAIERQAGAVRDARRAFNELGVPVSDLVGHEKALKRSIDATTASLHRQAVEGRRLDETAMQRSKAQQLLADRHERGRDAGLALASSAGIYGSHKVNEGTRATLETYREFDKYSRQTEAFGNFTKPEMEKIIAMAIHGDPDTRFNDIQWLQGAKALGGRGVKAGSVMGILPEAGRYAQAMGTDLPEGVAGLEGSLFGFQRDLSTPEKAQSAARRTADLQVAAAKAFGLTHHDLKGGYEYGTLGASTTGLSEEKLLAFLGLGKKLNIEGSAQGNAWRAMTGKFLSPTKKGREALAGVGVDYSSYQKMPDQLPVQNFENSIAQQYGVKLDDKAREALTAAFSDKKVFGEAGAFAVAVKDALKGQVGIGGARDANKVAGSAERFRQTNVEKVDVNGLMDALMEKMGGGNLALANAIFGEKQGTRIMAALRDGDVWRKSVKKLEETPEGKAKEVSAKMSGGFEGASARWEKAIKNMETAFGRSWDNGGEGGFLTGLVDQSAKLVQGLAEMNSGVLQVTTGIAWLGGKVIGGAGTIGLIGSAFALTKSAAELSAAAVLIGGKGAIPVGPAGAAAAGAGLTVGGVVTGGVIAGGAIGGAVADSLTPGTNVGITGLITGQESSLEQTNRVLRKDRDSAEVTKRIGYGGWRPKMTLPGGINPRSGFGTSYETSDGVFNDFLYGKQKTTTQLPGFGAGNKQMPQMPAGPIAAEVKSMPPLTGEVTGTGTLTVTVTPSPLLTTTIAGLERSVIELKGKVSSIGSNGPGSTGKSSPDAGKGGKD